MSNARSKKFSLPRMLQSPQLLFSGGIILLMGLLAILAPYISPHDPAVVSGKSRLAPPSVSHPLGADYLGRDILSSILHGARTSLSVSISSRARATSTAVAGDVEVIMFPSRTT